MKSLFRFDPYLFARGTEEFWIPAAIAAVSAAGQGVNQIQAQKRQNNAEVQAINNQEQYRKQANSQVKNLTDQIARDNPQQMAAKETGDFINTLRKNQQGAGTSSSALAPVAGASSRYGADVANSGKTVQQYGQTNAGEMSAIDSAIKQRQNEALAQQTLGTNLNLIGANSQSQNFVDQLRAQTAGQANPWVSLGLSMAQRGGQSMAKNGLPWKDYSTGDAWVPTVGNSAPTNAFIDTIKPNMPYG